MIADLMAKLQTAIRNLELKSVDRIGLQNDAFALAKARMIPTTDVFIF
jgi:hypothetical protein